MSVPAIKYMPIEDYLEMERAATEKHEYYRGEVFAMSGASLKHNDIQANLFGELYTALKGKPCKPYGSDLRIHIPTNSLFTYPDLVIVCGEPQVLDDAADTILNPTVIIEILSKSTQNYDRGDKFNLYRSIATLREYILIGSEFLGVEQYQKQPDSTWLLKEIKSLNDSLVLKSINTTIPLSQIYAGVSF